MDNGTTLQRIGEFFREDPDYLSTRVVVSGGTVEVHSVTRDDYHRQKVWEMGDALRISVYVLAECDEENLSTDVANFLRDCVSEEEWTAAILAAQ